MTRSPSFREAGIHEEGALHLARRSLDADKWMATTWIVLLVAAAYASAKATPWLFPTVAERTRAAEAINASPGIVALYGPILDTSSVGELSMIKMTVLYAVFVAIMSAVFVRRQARHAVRPGLLASTMTTAGLLEATCLSVTVGALAAVAVAVAGLPTPGAVAFGASWAGIGLVAATLTAMIGRLLPDARAARAATVASFALLFALRAIGDSLALSWLSWLSPFSWATHLEAWSTPRWWVLSLYVIASASLGALAVTLKKGSDHRLDGARTGQSLEVHRDGPVLVGWTLVTGGLAGYFGVVSADLTALLEAPHARSMIEQLGGHGPLPEALIAAEFSVIAAVITAFGIGAINHPAERRFAWKVAVALFGSAWLLLITGGMFALGQLASRGPIAWKVVGAAVNQTPAVWIVIAMTAVAWSLRPVWAKFGWGLLVLFTAVGPFGRLIGLPSWLVEFSPFARISPMPAENFDKVSTGTLMASCGVLLAIAAYNHRRKSADAGIDNGTRANQNDRHRHRR